jgi:membrane glycosyltransferase
MAADPSSARLRGMTAAADANATPTGTQSTRTLMFRRILFGALSALSLLGMTWWLAKLLAGDGFGAVDFIIVVMFLIHVPWIVIGFWNSVVGFLVLHFTSNPLRSVIPMVEKARADDPVFVGVAVFMTLRNEDPERAFLRLRTVKTSIDATGYGDRFDYYVLSDSTRPDVIDAEEKAYEVWSKEIVDVQRLIYRRRDKNTGFKAGNVRDFVERWGSRYDLMVPLDADSLMTGEAILRLVRVMQANPRLGILQSLVVGMPTPSFFARVFQFGMRHAMRSFTAGSAWWHADCGPFWGHNAVIRVAPFREHCHLPDLPGKPPLGGHILSHDQIEAVMMRHAGFEVRVLPEEEGSWEENPPALPDFAVRDLRWCQGNLQYFKLVNLPKLPTSRFNILFAIQMFVGVAAFVLFTIFTALACVMWPANMPFAAGSALALYLLYIFMFLTPKIAGVLDAILRSPARYGGTARLLAGGLVDTLFGFLLTSISMVGQSMFMAALVFGRSIRWDGQRRDRYRLAWSEAARMFWPHTLFGWALFALLALGAPGAIVWFLPFIAGPMLVIPFAVLTTDQRLAAYAERVKLCAIPEEFDLPVELEKILPRPHA